MTLQQLRCLCAVADHELGVSRAAATLHLTQSAVSKMIRALEKELDLEIFLRQGNRLVGVTEAGREAIALARRMMHDKTSLAALAREMETDQSGTLRICTTPLHARYALLPAIERFARAYPAVDLDIRHGRPDDVLNAVAAGDADFGVCTVPERIPPRVLTFDAYPIDYCLIVPATHALAMRKSVSIREIANYPLISYNENFNSGFVVKREFQRHGLAPRIVIKASDAGAVKAYVAAGLGIAVILKMAFDPKRDRGVKAIDTSGIFPVSVAKVSVRSGQPLRRFTREFISMFSVADLSEML